MSSTAVAQPDAAVFASDLGFIEGPVWDPAARTLSLVSISRGRVYILDETGRQVGRTETGGGPNGMTPGPEGLLVTQNGGIFGAPGPAAPGVQRIGREGVSYAFAGAFQAPNDLAWGPDGKLYVTDPGSERAILEPVVGRVLACDPASGSIDVVVGGRLCPNGLAFTADGAHLLLAQTYARVVERFAFADGALVSQGTFCRLANGRPDGMAIDAAGNVWVCTPGTGGVEIFSADGVPVRRIDLGPGTMTTNLCFGGTDGREVFVTAAGIGKVLRLRAEAPGLALRCRP